MVFSIFLYGSESWTVKSADRHRIDAFEMWCWRRMLRIPWTARRTNQSILNDVGITDRLSTICRRHILQYFNHITRRGEDNLEKLIVQGKVEGRRPRGRSPSRWLDQIANITGKQYYISVKSPRGGRSPTMEDQNHQLHIAIMSRFFRHEETTKKKKTVGRHPF